MPAPPDLTQPVHPGVILREDAIRPTGEMIAEIATRLGVSRQALSNLLRGAGGLSPAMARRLEQIGWSTAAVWRALQARHDAWRDAQPSAQPRRKRGRPRKPR